MDIKRVVLYTALVLVVYSLWTNWQVDYPAPKNIQTVSTAKTSEGHLLPNASTESKAEVTPNMQKPSSNAPKIRVTTDVLDLAIDTQNGDIVNAQLVKYPQSTEQKDKPFTLLQDNDQERYVANSGLVVVEGEKIENVNPNFTAENNQFELTPGNDRLQVVLKGKTAEGLVVNKLFTFTKGSYLIDVQYQILNESSVPWKGYMNTQLLQSSPKEDKSSMFHIGSYTGASYSVPGQDKYKKVPFKDMTKDNLDTEAKGGWIAMQQHYFLSAWVPNQETTNRFYTRYLNGDYSIGSVSHAVNVAPGETKQIGSRLYLGPEDTSTLKTIAPGLDLTVDYGLLWMISSLLFSVIKAIYSFVGNWGWAIVLVTVLIKLAFYPLSATSYRSMAAMRKLQPKLQSLRERYGDDKAKMSQATMELYRQEKVNPLGGCLPIIIQIPVFIALYWVLIESVELRQAPFILWINDLAAADPYHVLPVIMGITMLVQQRLNPAPPDPTQAKIMMFLPILFTALFWSFPAGLVLYWIVNNTLSILQQWYVTRKYSDEKPKKKMVTVK